MSFLEWDSAINTLINKTFINEFYSLALSIKMNILFFGPGFLSLLLVANGWKKTILNLSICALVQVVNFNIDRFQILSSCELFYKFLMNMVFGDKWKWFGFNFQVIFLKYLISRNCINDQVIPKLCQIFLKSVKFI